MKSLFINVFVCLNFLTYKMQEEHNLLDHVDKVKKIYLVMCLGVFMWNESNFMSLLKNLPPLYKYLIIALETMRITIFTIEYDGTFDARGQNAKTKIPKTEMCAGIMSK